MAVDALVAQLRDAKEKIDKGARQNPITILSDGSCTFNGSEFTRDELQQISNLVDTWLSTNESARLSDLRSDRRAMLRDLRTAINDELK